MTAPAPAPAVRAAAPRSVLGLDTGTADLPAADALLHALAGLPADTVACTHRILGEHPHVAVTVEVSAADAPSVWPLLRAAADAVPGGGASWGHRRHGAAPAAEAANAAAASHALGRGRAVRYPGAASLTGTLAVGELLDRSAIERVSLRGGGTAGAADRVATRGHVRPERRGGALVLLVAADAGGRLAPLEEPPAGPRGAAVPPPRDGNAADGGS
ncbi:hypothetical protein LO771_09515 [Streptacidiphilus sp. ASG 303]|uniref:hypothetical protein n=1 Tax=Streptacidiphilus sp. ASG 303 TaxID=2896847 RepID=UPI001E35EB5A|nr:hypothetical protein [Streptacidiphilus sp. ASG 303]MCD0482632.1 hypothetical protein [Streptacidiphilus sp. ASG 303]